MGSPGASSPARYITPRSRPVSKDSRRARSPQPAPRALRVISCGISVAARCTHHNGLATGVLRHLWAGLTTDIGLVLWCSHYSGAAMSPLSNGVVEPHGPFLQRAVGAAQTHDDAMNIDLAVYCRRLNCTSWIVSRITHDRNLEAIHRAGADFVLSYTTLGIEAAMSVV